MCIDYDWYIFILYALDDLFLSTRVGKNVLMNLLTQKLQDFPLTDSDFGSLSSYLIIISNKPSDDASVAGTSL